MIYITHKISVLLKNQLNYPRDSIFKYFFKEHNRLSLFLFFLTTYKDERFKAWKRERKKYNIIKDVGNLFRLKKK